MTEQEKKPGVLLSPRVEDPPVVTMPERQFGGPQSGLPPPYIIGSAVAPYLILGIDFGSNFCRFSTFVDGAAYSLNPHAYRALVEDALSIPIDPNRLVHSLKYCISYGYSVKHHDRVSSSTELVTSYLNDLKTRIQDRTRKLISKAVISVPAFFTHNQRQAIIQAASEADIAVLALINEPTAAALHNCFTTNFARGKCVVISSGTYSFEASLIDVQNGLLEVKATRGDRALSGHEMTCRLVEEVKKNYSVTCSTDWLHSQCDAAKVKLDLGTSVTLDLVDQSVELNRTMAAEALRESIVQIRALLNGLLKDSLVDAKEITRVILTGESAKSWLLIAELVDLFPTGVPRWANVSAGASIYAALLTRQIKDWVIWDCLADPAIVAQGKNIRGALAADSPLPITGHAELMPDQEGLITASILQTRKDSQDHDVTTVATVRVLEELPQSEKASVDLFVTATPNGTFSFAARHKTLDVNLTLDVQAPTDESKLLDLSQVSEPGSQTTSNELTPSEPREICFTPGLTLRSYDRRWFVYSVAENSAAESAGIEVFSEVVQVDSSDPNVLDVAAKLQGPPSSQISITLTKKGWLERVTLARDTEVESPEKLRSIIATAAISGTKRELVKALLNLSYSNVRDIGTLEQRTIRYDESKSAAERALETALANFDSRDSLVLESVCILCRALLKLAVTSTRPYLLLEKPIEHNYHILFSILRAMEKCSNSAVRCLLELSADHEDAIKVFQHTDLLKELRKSIISAVCSNQLPFELWKETIKSDPDLIHYVCGEFVRQNKLVELDRFLDDRINNLSWQNPQDCDGLVSSILGQCQLQAIRGNYDKAKTLYIALIREAKTDNFRRFQYLVRFLEFLMRIDDYWADRCLARAEKVGRFIGVLNDDSAAIWAKAIRSNRGKRYFY